MILDPSAVHLFDVPSLLPEFDIKEIERNLKYVGLVFQEKPGRHEKKIITDAKRAGIACFLVENLNSAQLCANLVYNLNQIGEFVYVFTNEILLFQIIGPRTTIYFKKEGKFYDIKEVEEKFGIEPWKIADLFSFIGFKEKEVPGVLGIEIDKILKWLKYFSSAEELLARPDLLEFIENQNTFHFQNLLKKQEKKIIENLKKLKIEPNYLFSIKKEAFLVRKKSRII